MIAICKRPLAALAAVSALLPLLAGDAAADRPSAPKLLPENTLVMVRIHDAKQFIEQMGETSAGRMANDPELKPLLQHLYGSANEAFVAVEKEVGVSLNDVVKIPQGEICFAMIDKGTGNEPGVLLLMDCGDSVADARRIVDRLIEEGVKNGETVRTHQLGGNEIRTVNEAAVMIKEGAVLVANSLELTAGVADMWDGKLQDVATLADNKSYTTIMKKCLGAKGERPQATIFVDPVGIVRMATRGNLGAAAAMALMEPLGVYGIEGVGGSLILGADEFESIAHIHLLLESPREGVVKAIAMRSGETAPPPWVPENVASYATLHWDLQETYAAIETMFDLVRGEGQMEQMVGRRLTDRLGVDFKEELLGQMAGRATMITWIEPQPKINAQCTLVGVELRDADKMRKTLDALALRFADTMMPDSHAGVSFYRLPTWGGRGRRRPPAEAEPADDPFGQGQQAPRPRRRRPMAGLARQPTPSVAVFGGCLLMTDSRELLKAAVDAKRSGKSLADDLEFKLVEGKIKRHLAGVDPGMLQFNRPEENLKAMYGVITSPQVTGQLARGAERGNRGAQAIQSALDENPLPPFSVLADYLAPGGAMIADSDTGLHYTVFSLRRETGE